MGEIFRTMRIAVTVALWLVCGFLLTGCLVAGYTSGGGLWLWPGSIVITLVLAALWYFTRR